MWCQCWTVVRNLEMRFPHQKLYVLIPWVCCVAEPILGRLGTPSQPLQLVVLFRKVGDTLGDGVSLKEVGHWRQAIRPYSPTHFLFTSCFLSEIGGGKSRMAQEGTTPSAELAV